MLNAAIKYSADGPKLWTWENFVEEEQKAERNEDYPTQAITKSQLRKLCDKPLYNALTTQIWLTRSPLIPEKKTEYYK